MNTVHIGSRLNVCPTQIKLLRADVNYTYIHFFDARPKLVSTTLKTLESRLVKKGFLRVNRKEMVNLNHVKTYYRTRDKDFVVLNDDTVLIPSRRGRVVLREYFEQSNSLHKKIRTG